MSTIYSFLSTYERDYFVLNPYAFTRQYKLLRILVKTVYTRGLVPIVYVQRRI